MEGVGKDQRQPPNYPTGRFSMVCLGYQKAPSKIIGLTLSRIKVADVTWLFGPIAEDGREQFPSSPTPNSVASSVCEHNAETRPILKKRATISEAILQHSLSSDCLIQHANLPPKPQTKGHPFGLERTVSDNVVPTAHVGSSLRATPSSQSPTSSEMSSRSTNSRRHISFNRVVSQVIAVGREEDYDDDDDETESDSTLVTMKPLHPRRSSNGSNVSKSSFNSDTRTIIAHLPPTTLKDDSDAEKEHEFRHINWSQDRPSLFREYSDDFKYPEASKLGATSEHIEFFEFENDWFEKATPVNIPSSPSTPFPVAETVHTTSTNGAWFRPSPEGFVPFFEYDRDRGKVDEESHADLQTGPGLIGRIVDIVHTVRDIAHVVWNVGWRL